MTGERGPGDGGVVEPAGTGHPVEDGSLDVPNCPVCLHRMEPAGTASGGVYWACTECGQTRLA
ncbi:hypothetical protein [Amnibacterium sp.]|uniref:hypothetical protein n=1 Tax=Amnibacterium sp. TaxID=1872496 RepID=UPI002634A740|nr:hypothetical protein [Amnibacterium sp.]MCU1472297.1 hypothetical protein [Amnibacterium sp.]